MTQVGEEGRWKEGGRGWEVGEWEKCGE